MLQLIIGLVLFFSIHSTAIIANPWRLKIKAQIGEMPWKAIYAVISIIGFYLIVIGYIEARLSPTIIYEPPVWTRHITFLLMLPVFPLILAAYLPGKIQAKLKHPMLVATKTWALAHLIANGALADIVLFGSFLVWAVVDRISLKRRHQTPMLQAPGSRFNDVVAVLGGLAAYVVFILWGHTILIGMPLISRAG